MTDPQLLVVIVAFAAVGFGIAAGALLFNRKAN